MTSKREDREALIEEAAYERYPDIEANPETFPTGWSRESERNAFIAGVMFEQAQKAPCLVCGRTDGAHKMGCHPQNRKDAEKAHTPTDDGPDHEMLNMNGVAEVRRTAQSADDEREAVEAEAERLWPTGREYSPQQTAAVFSVKELDAYCASAFTRGARYALALRRPVQGEPTAPMSLADDPMRAPFQKRREPQGEPTDDEREALAALIDPDASRAGWNVDAHDVRDQIDGLHIKRGVYRAVDRILSAGFRRTVQGEPTDAQVDAAFQSILNTAHDVTTREDMRAALRAAAVVTEQAERPMIECPHWEPGFITIRTGCTACAAVTEQGGENRG